MEEFRNGGIRPFEKLKKDELLDELISRNVKGKIMNMKKKDLERVLREDVLKGVARLPAPFLIIQMCHLLIIMLDLKSMR